MMLLLLLLLLSDCGCNCGCDCVCGCEPVAVVAEAIEPVERVRGGNSPPDSLRAGGGRTGSYGSPW